MKELLERLEGAAKWSNDRGDLVYNTTVYKQEGKPASPRDKVFDVEVRVSMSRDKDGDKMGRATVIRKDSKRTVKVMDGAVGNSREAKSLGEKALGAFLKETDRYTK